MENVVLIIHLILALGLIGVVLLQRSEGGGLGIGGSGGPGGQRAALSPLGKMTWVLAMGFIVTSITLTVLAARSAGGSSILDRIGGGAAVQTPADAGSGPADLDIDSILPPPAAGSANDAPLTPRAD
jgi:preprotein translocase subunit SecG